MTALAASPISRRKSLRRASVLILVGAFVLAASVTYLSYTRDLDAARARLTAGSQVIETPHGLIEYAVKGSGPTVLVIHGAGGGYDQGLLLSRAFGGDNFQWIAPSRFGYLRTPLPPNASTAAQADALADLLDTLGVQRVSIVAHSGGVPPALQFALRHPERTSALVLMAGAPYTPLTAAEQKTPVPVWVYQALFSSDFPYWVLQKVARPNLEAIFDVSPALRASLTTEESGMVSDMVDAFEPVTWRIAGVRNEGAAIAPDARNPIEKITVPTLVVHAQDDAINPVRYSEYTAEHIPGAEFLRLPDGGHLLLGHQAEVRAKVNAFLKQINAS